MCVVTVTLPGRQAAETPGSHCFWPGNSPAYYQIAVSFFLFLVSVLMKATWLLAVFSYLIEPNESGIDLLIEHVFPNSSSIPPKPHFLNSISLCKQGFTKKKEGCDLVLQTIMSPKLQNMFIRHLPVLISWHVNSFSLVL